VVVDPPPAFEVAVEHVKGHTRLRSHCHQQSPAQTCLAAAVEDR
jgi:hypothetical protein